MTPKSQLQPTFEEVYDIDISLKSGYFDEKGDPFAGAPQKVVIRKMVVDMEILNTALEAKAPHWKELEVYADTLVFPLKRKNYGNGFAFKLGHLPDQKVTLFARTILFPDGNGSFVNYNDSTSMTIWAKEIPDGKLFYNVISGGNIDTLNLNVPTGKAGIQVKGKELRALEARELPSNMLQDDAAVYWLLQSGFNTAAVLGSYASLKTNENKRKASSHDPAELAINILSWIHQVAVCGDGIAMQHLALNAASTEAYFKLMARKVTFVPALGEEVYKGISKDFLEAASNAERDFKDSLKALRQTKQLDAYVSANRDYFGDQTGVAKRLIENAAANVEAAETVLKQNMLRLQNLVREPFGEIVAARKAFKKGVEDFKKKKEKEAEKGVITAILSVGSSLALMAAGDEAAGASAATGIAKAAEGAAVAEKEVSKIQKVVAAVKKIAAVGAKLKDVLEKLKKAREAIKELSKAKNLKSSDFGTGIKLPEKSDSDVYDGAYWETLNLNVTALLLPFTMGKDTKIDGASDYLKKLQILCVVGKAVYANQITLMQLQQKLLQQVLEEKVAEDQLTRLQALTNADAASLAEIEKAKVLTFQNLLQIKARVVYFMNLQMAALRYWSAKPSSSLTADQVPMLADSVAELGRKLAGIAEDRITTSATFGGAPAPMHEFFVIDDEVLIAHMRNTKKLTWTMPIDQKQFLNDEGNRLWGRIRIARARAYLNLGENGEKEVHVKGLPVRAEGDKPLITDKNKSIVLKFTTSSHYLDVFKGGKVMEYISPPFHPHNFSYTVNAWDQPEEDGVIVDDDGKGKLAYTFFEPTPYTTWTVEIVNAESYDLEQLRHVTLHLTGGVYSV